MPGQFFSYIFFFWHQAISDHFPRWPPEKLVGTITYEPLDGGSLLFLFIYLSGHGLTWKYLHGFLYTPSALSPVHV